MSLPQAPIGLSMWNVLASVVLMSAVLFRRSARHGIARGWPLSWCVTIPVNMMLFLCFSLRWWEQVVSNLKRNRDSEMRLGKLV